MRQGHCKGHKSHSHSFDFSRQALESGQLKMPIEGKHPLNSVPLHQGKRDTIGKANRLVGEFAEVRNRVQLVGFCGTQDPYCS